MQRLMESSRFAPHVLSGCQPHAGRVRDRKHTVTDILCPHWYTTWVILQGSGNFHLDGQSLSVQSPAVIVIPPGQAHQVDIPAATEFAYLEWGLSNSPRVSREGDHDPSTRYVDRVDQPSTEEALGICLAHSITG